MEITENNEPMNNDFFLYQQRTVLRRDGQQDNRQRQTSWNKECQKVILHTQVTKRDTDIMMKASSLHPSWQD